MLHTDTDITPHGEPISDSELPPRIKKDKKKKKHRKEKKSKTVSPENTQDKNGQTDSKSAKS